MDIELSFSNSKWDILKELSKSPKSPLEIATILKTSVANISQQLRLLEALGLVSKSKLQNSLKGKPRMQYFITSEITYLVRLGKKIAIKQMLKKDPYTIYIFNTFSLIPKKDQFYLLKFYFINSELLANSSIGYFKTTDKTIELFIITNEIEKVRNKISNLEITNQDLQTKKIISWSHNKAEIEIGLKNKDPHFINLVKDSTIMLDESNSLEKYKEMS